MTQNAAAARAATGAAEAFANGVFVVAEIGINHNGDLDLARRLVDAAQAAGCDAVKFQKRTIDLVYAPEVLAQPRRSPWGATQRAQKEGLEFGAAQYDAIDAHCRALGIAWFASAWDLESQAFLAGYDLPYNKIASAMIDDLGFVAAVAAEGRTTFVSTGLSTLDDVDAAVAVLRGAACPFVPMHTVSTYPTPAGDLNLRALQTLQRRYGGVVGYSGHEAGHEAGHEPSLVAAALGARVIERHLTLDRGMYGSDQAASLEPGEMRRLVQLLRALPAWLGDGVKRLMPGEAEVAAKLRARPAAARA